MDQAGEGFISSGKKNVTENCSEPGSTREPQAVLLGAGGHVCANPC